MRDTTRMARLTGADGENKARLLLVEDDDTLRSALTRVLSRRFDVTATSDGASAAELLVAKTFDVVLSDIGLPRTSGVDLLRLVRAYDLDVPVVLMTGQPSLETAIAAVDLGALTYIQKPFEQATLDAALERATKLATIARIKRDAVAAGIAGSPLAGEKTGLGASFERALESLWIAYQPIVDRRTRRTMGYEALMRTEEATMQNPAELLHAADRLGRVRDLSRRVRERAAAGFEPERSDLVLFVNLHATDLLDPQLYERDAPLSRMADRVVLEITERATLDEVKDVRRRTGDLRALGFQLAIDDLGAGYAGLTSFATLEPEIVKLDMSLVRGIETSPVKSHIVERVTALCRELGMRVVAEGIETSQELGRLVGIGCDYFQGYLFGRPSRDRTPSAHTW